MEDDDNEEEEEEKESYDLCVYLSQRTKVVEGEIGERERLGGREGKVIGGVDVERRKSSSTLSSSSSFSSSSSSTFAMRDPGYKCVVICGYMLLSLLLLLFVLFSFLIFFLSLLTSYKVEQMKSNHIILGPGKGNSK